MKPFNLSSEAEADLASIWDFIAQDSFNAADRVLLELQTAMEKLADMPNIGHRRADIEDPRYRFWPVYSYLIVYLPDTAPLQIARVVHGYRDMPSILH